VLITDCTARDGCDKPTAEQRQALYDKAQTWWTASKDKVIWDRTAQKFVLPQP
jgi:hypothetical protein